jgi:hypothetical protein
MGKRLKGPYLHLPGGMIASLFALVLIQGGTGNADTPPSLQNETRDVLTQEEALIVTTLNEVANAESQFSKTKDAVSILHFYAQEYAGIKDGKSETVKDQKNYLAEVLEQINSDEHRHFIQGHKHQAKRCGKSRMGNL